MTTIATDGKTITSDSRVIGDYIEQGHFPKMFRVGDEIVGICGSYADGLAYVHWLNSGKKEDDKPKVQDFEAIHVSAAGVMWVGKNLHPIKSARIVAIGSGGAYAMGAMLAGTSSRKAVAIAKKLDPGTGGKLITMRLK
jgi:ATP-dependent protease HslVU (ClpYQ) peptidase subunit